MFLRILGLVLGLIAVASAGAQTLRPEPGLWYNPKRSGHGVDFQFAGNTLVGIWYTYDSTGRPTWYIASAAYTGTTWSAPLLGARWNGSAAILTEVGTIGLRVHDDDRADFSWNIGGNTGGEPFERLRFAAGAPVANLTGIYHHAAQTGWGLSFEVQGSVAAAVLYFYDSAGLPRWVLGTAPASAGAQEAGASIPMSAFGSGSSSNAPYFGAPSQAPAGTLALDNGRLTIDVLLPGGLGGWQRDVPATRLTDDSPPYFSARIQGPAIIPSGASAPYSASFDTNIVDLSTLQFEWTVIYGSRIVQSTANSVEVRPLGDEGLVVVQLEVAHPATGLRDFATFTVSAQAAGIFDVAIVSGRPEVLVGRNHRFDAVVLGGSPPFTYQWSGEHLTIEDAASTFVDPPCTAVADSDISVSVRDAQGREAQATFQFRYAPALCSLSIYGPGCMDPGELTDYLALANGLPTVIAGRNYVWASSLAGPLPACAGPAATACRLTGPTGPATDYYTLRVDHPTLGSAQRVLARACGDELDLSLTTSRETVADAGGEVDVDLSTLGGIGPYSFFVQCGLNGPSLQLPPGPANRSARCAIPATSYNTVPIFAQVRDSALRAADQIRYLTVIPGAPPLSISLDAPSAPPTCVPANLTIGILNGTPPFNINLDYGDNSSYTSTGSARSIPLQHEYAPASAGSPRSVRLVVTDALGARDELTHTLTPVNSSVDVDVALRNAAGQNIHIYDRATPAGGWFDIGTRITPGSVRNVDVTIPANACEAQVEWGAGRSSTQLTMRTCTYRKRQPSAGVTYSESGGAALSCDSAGAQ